MEGRARGGFIRWVLGCALLAACSADDDAMDGATMPMPMAGAPGAGAGSTAEMVREEGMPCGDTRCVSPPDSMGFINACCLDASASTCGVSFGGRACERPFEPDERCPSVDANGLLLGGCCVQGMCGLDGTSTGVPCLELSRVARDTSDAGIAIPAPRACDAMDP